MKITRYIALAAVLIFAVLGLSAFAWGFDTATDQSTSADNSSKSSLQLQSEDQPAQAVTAVSRAESALQLHKAWVKERVGMTVLNAARVKFDTVHELAGVRTDLLKPKISTYSRIKSDQLGFSGLGGNHFARADV